MERINGYETMLANLDTEDQYLSTLFEAFIKQSMQLSDELRQAYSAWGLVENQLAINSRFGLAWSVVKAVFSSRMPTYLLDKCKSGENALLIAYHSVEVTDGLLAPIRLLVNKQKREVIAARDWITHFERLRKSSSQYELVAVS